MTLIAHVSPAQEHYAETEAALVYAHRIKKVRGACLVLNCIH